VPAETGRPGYHPATPLKIYIYGYLNRIQSSWASLVFPDTTFKPAHRLFEVDGAQVSDCRVPTPWIVQVVNGTPTLLSGE